MLNLRITCPAQEQICQVGSGDVSENAWQDKVARIFNIKGNDLDRATAENLMKNLLDLSASMNTIAGQIEGIDAEEQKMVMRRGISNLMGAIYSDLMRPIIREYKDLDPDK